MSDSTILDIISGIVVPIGTLYISYKINAKYTNGLEIKRKREEEKKLSIEEAKATKKSVEVFSKEVMRQYLDVLNNGESYKLLLNNSAANSTINDFVDVREFFKDDKLYRNCGKWDNYYDKIKEFYETKVFGQYNGPDYTFAKDYITLIHDLGLDSEMETRREYIRNRH